MFSGPIGHKGYLYWPDGSREKASCDVVGGRSTGRGQLRADLSPDPQLRADLPFRGRSNTSDLPPKACPASHTESEGRKRQVFAVLLRSQGLSPGQARSSPLDK